jgi:Na+-driven multidrug efflux pump
MAPFLMNVAACVIVIFINNGLQQHGGDLAIGAYGIVNRITFIFVMVVMGLNQGMQPIAGYNYGARNIDRMLSVLKLTIVWATVIMTTGFVICEFMPGLIARIFTSDEELIARSVRGMRIVAVFFPIIGMQMVTGNFFQSIGMARQAIFLSLTRQLIFLLPCLIVLPQFFGADGVWASLPTADLLSWIVSVSVLMYYLRRFKQGKIEYKL